MNINNHKGNILLITLLLVSIAAAVTVTAMRGTVLQEKMVDNQNSKAVSFKAAESGAASFMKWFKDPGTTWNSNTWQNTIPTTPAGNQNMGATGYYWIDPNDVVWSAASVTLKVRGYAKSDNSATANAKTTLQITLTNPAGTGGPAQQIIGSGIVAGGNIIINGNANIDGNLFSNGNVSVSGGNSDLTGTIAAVGTASIYGVDASLVTSGAVATSVPVIADAWLAEMSAAAAVQSCALNLSGDQGGKIYYCAGDATLAGNFSNATIVATGSVTQNGSGQLGGSGQSSTAVTVAIAAKGNITFNGSGDTYAVIWSNGNYIHDGLGALRGSLTAGGIVTSNGVFTFEEITEVQNDYISTGGSAGGSSITQWQEIFE
jgi:Tfp pilus assembly protein PilX